MMRCTVGLSVLSLLCLHSSLYVQILHAQDSEVGVLVFCDDPDVSKAVMNAVDTLNKNVLVGHKLALFQVVTASKSENGSVYWLQFTTRRSECRAGADKSWQDCDYLPKGRKNPIMCNATVHMTETETHTTQVSCELEDHITSDIAHCLGCAVDVDVEAEELKVPLSVSIAKYNSMSDSTHLFTLNSVGPATRQVVAGLRFKISFDMRKSTCAKSENKELHELCVADANDVELANCNSTVDTAPWRHEAPNAHIECGPGPLPITVTHPCQITHSSVMSGGCIPYFDTVPSSPQIFRRRPAGWTPLRNFVYPAPASLKASEPEESSEEDVATTPALPSSPVLPTLPASASVAPDVEVVDPFHCPSKPWKPFIELEDATAAPEAPAEPTSNATVAPKDEGGFRDTDLLGA
ncbi:kininogen-1 [Genypterus blacodes]|uniref:kininogen-1 n=1 Tax=Genypterus blacodes TaxID=154954 RepID=UPI003F758AD1